MMKVLFRALFLCFFALFLHHHSFAQFSCGSRFTAQQQTILSQVNSITEGSVVPDYCLKKTLSIAAHIVLDSLGQPNMTMVELDSAIEVLNRDFAPICLSFRVCSVEYIPAYKYDRFHDAQEGGEIKAIYNIPRMINMYFVKDILDPMASGGGPAGGFAPSPPTADSSDYIVIKKGLPLTGKKTISHEMGHFFGLAHTFEGAPQELNNGSNCQTTGDMICDTPPDGNPMAIDPGTCEYTGALTDPNGELLTPIIGNIMSYHPATCKCGFTVGQYNAMARVYLLYRTYLF